MKNNIDRIVLFLMDHLLTICTGWFTCALLDHLVVPDKLVLDSTGVQDSERLEQMQLHDHHFYIISCLQANGIYTLWNQDKTGHLFYLRTVVTFRQHNTASPATILELLVRIKIVEIVQEEGAHQLLISTSVDTWVWEMKLELPLPVFDTLCCNIPISSIGFWHFRVLMRRRTCLSTFLRVDKAEKNSCSLPSLSWKRYIDWVYYASLSLNHWMPWKICMDCQMFFCWKVMFYSLWTSLLQHRCLSCIYSNNQRAVSSNSLVGTGPRALSEDGLGTQKQSCSITGWDSLKSRILVNL